VTAKLYFEWYNQLSNHRRKTNTVWSGTSCSTCRVRASLKPHSSYNNNARHNSIQYTLWSSGYPCFVEKNRDDYMRAAVECKKWSQVLKQKHF